MELAQHPFGLPYFHIPSGKVIYLSNKYSDGSYSAHYQYRESMTVKPDDLRIPLTSEIKEHYPKFGDWVLIDGGEQRGQMIDIVGKGGAYYQIDIGGKWVLFLKERVKKDPKCAIF